MSRHGIEARRTPNASKTKESGQAALFLYSVPSLPPNVARCRSWLGSAGAIFLRWHSLRTRCTRGGRRRICLRAACGSIGISFNSSAIAARLLVHLLRCTLSIGAGHPHDKCRCRYKHGDRLHCVSLIWHFESLAASRDALVLELAPRRRRQINRISGPHVALFPLLRSIPICDSSGAVTAAMPRRRQDQIMPPSVGHGVPNTGFKAKTVHRSRATSLANCQTPHSTK